MSIIPAETIADSPIPKVHYTTVNIRDILVHRDEKTSNTASRVVGMEINGVDDEVHCTDRFINSLLGIFGVARSTFDLFSHEEVVSRIIERGRGDCVRIALQHNKGGSYTALAAIKPTKPFVEAFDLWELMRDKLDIDVSNMRYHSGSGVVRTEHEPSVLGKGKLDVAGDDVVRRFVMDVPIDGYGMPSAFLQITRQVCSNGMIGEAPAFKSCVNLGDTQTVIGGNIVSNAIPTLQKFIESHNNEEGFHVMTERMRTASNSPASLDEFNRLYRVLTGSNMQGLHRDRKGEETIGVNSDITSTLYHLAGDHLMEKYGLISLDQLSPKKRKLVPVDCSVMDLINVASELSTHRADAHQQRKISAFIGQTLADEFDLENMGIDPDTKRTDFYFKNPPPSDGDQ